MKKLPQHLSQLMHQSGALPELTERAELLLYLDKTVKAMLSGPVCAQLTVANFRQNTLVIETSTAVWAARLNFQKAHLLQQLQSEALPMLTAIEVKVNPTLIAREVKPNLPHRQISETTAAHLTDLAESTGGSLGQKLKRLAALASRKGTENSN
ncbi:DciA family protein [Shewanella sp. A3A]|uniref:DciA family protein n=1 Tax=Shewanella electrica TaxID=515560 RepID=A0ABT2FN85_9GAMM|nr:DciA family protein [Shewanella electrica]MCH1920671.1 DciA family protein [Shewanella ferrihydritica]MCH1926434.1 DciA family protein [Shewanella electrica]MCS4557795.1 DciA family protein [Shewanella electrica]